MTDIYSEAGKARAKSLTKAERSAIARKGGIARRNNTTKADREAAARKAALARWGKKHGKGRATTYGPAQEARDRKAVDDFRREQEELRQTGQSRTAASRKSGTARKRGRPRSKSG